MSARDVRATKRNERAIVDVKSTPVYRKKQSILIEEEAPPLHLEKIADPISTEQIAGPISIIYKSEHGVEPERQIVILPYVRDEYWQNTNIAYFRSTGSSNEGCGWLCGTFFPTGGITTKIKEGGKTIGINSECPGTEGHLLKMSDIINNVGVFVGIESFCTTLALVIEDIIYSPSVFKKTPKPPEFDNYMAGPTINEVFNAFNSYFISEQQLMLSYQLTPPNLGLWGWRFGNFVLADFCKSRWGDIPHIMAPPLSAVPKLNKETTCNFIKQHDASVNFDVLHNSFKILQGPKPRNACVSKVNAMERVFNMAKGIHNRSKKRKNTKNKREKTKQQNKRFKTKRR